MNAWCLGLHSPGVPSLTLLTFRLGRMLKALATAPSLDRKSTRLNSSHVKISYAVFCSKKKSRLLGGSALQASPNSNSRDRHADPYPRNAEATPAPLAHVVKGDWRIQRHCQQLDRQNSLCRKSFPARQAMLTGVSAFFLVA